MRPSSVHRGRHAWGRHAWLVPLLVLAACGEGAAPPASAPSAAPPASAPSAPTPSTAPAADEEPAPVASPARRDRTHLDLYQLAHLADLDVGGLFVDFGTRARAKYTSGDWNSGWVDDRESEGVPVSRFGTMGRVYLPGHAGQPARLVLRVRPVAESGLLAFVNNTKVGELEYTPGGFREVSFEIPANAMRDGENYLLLRGLHTEGGVSYEVDWAHLRAASPSEAGAAALDEDAFEPPRGVARPHVAEGDARESLVLPARARMSHHLETPPESQLVFAVSGAGRWRVRAQAEGDPSARTLAEGSASAGWSAQVADLSPLGSKIVRLDFETEEGSVAFAEPRVVVPEVELAPAPAIRNVIVLTIDTLRASKLQVYNPRSRVRTPALDRFATEATLFERAQAPENWTKPSVASILTSLFPATHGTKNDGSVLPASVLTLGEVYQEAGFETASFLANGYVSDAFGFRQGWDHYTNYIRERRNTDASNVFREAARWIEGHQDERFFVYIQTIDPHVPYDPPDSYLRMYDPEPYDGPIRNRNNHTMLEEVKRGRATFSARDKIRLEALHDAEISDHDEHFGAFLARLEELGLSDSTLFVITSDHGEEFEEHGSWGHGHSVYQELLHVPLLVRWPGVGRAGARVPEVVSTMDIGPTILEASGVPVPEVFEGRSLAGFVRGAPPTGPSVAFSDFQENRRVIRALDYKLILRSSLTYVFFDLGADPNERHELDGRAHPIAMRYLRTMSGQFLGAQNRANWLAGGGVAVRHDAETTMTEALCRQLVALGYMDCLTQFPGAGS